MEYLCLLFSGNADGIVWIVSKYEFVMVTYQINSCLCLDYFQTYL